MESKNSSSILVNNSRLIKEWNYEKNEGIDPFNISLGSHKKVWWKCDKGHEWQATVRDRANGNGCPYCSNKRIIAGYNDLGTKNPKLASEWNYDKNDGLLPNAVAVSSNKKVWWKCDKGHEWQATINSRNSSGNGCPYCANQKTLKGYNDLVTINPKLASEWDYEKNNELTPYDVTPFSDKKVWWKCDKGHEWQTTIKNRSLGRGCPVCSSARHTSFPEYALLYYLAQSGLDTVHLYKELGYELDIYIPSKKIAIEFDGGYWHKNKIDADLKKNSKCRQDGIILYRIRDGLPSLEDSSIDYVVENNLEDTLAEVLGNIIGYEVTVDFKKDTVKIENLREHYENKTSLASSNPKTAIEWNYARNGNLKPEHYSANSSKVVWWKCDQNHEWQSSIKNRNKGHGCPYCAGKKAISGYNDLQTINPQLAKEWNYEKNGELMPWEVLPNSGKKVWWKCDRGHEWQAAIYSRNSGNGCPICANQEVLKGYNDLMTINPQIASEWNYEKNDGLMPWEVLPNSGEKVWWKCDKGHEWQTTIHSRNSGNGCPVCSNKKILKGYNDLQTINPQIASEWKYEKNDGLMPCEVLPNSGKKVWWKCDKGHEWQATIDHRNKGQGCPYCSGRYAVAGYNDLQTINPQLAKEWNYEKNGELMPWEVLPNSGKKVWWKCGKGHEWQAAIYSRNSGYGCPICAKMKKLCKHKPNR